MSNIIPREPTRYTKFLTRNLLPDIISLLFPNFEKLASNIPARSCNLFVLEFIINLGCIYSILYNDINSRSKLHDIFTRHSPDISTSLPLIEPNNRPTM